MPTRAPGVGPKLGGRIVSELKDKVGNMALGPSAPGVNAVPPAQGPAVDAISALVNLGYRPVEAQRAVQTAAGALGEGAELQTLIRDSLRHLAS